jgi:hypothetical protein
VALLKRVGVCERGGSKPHVPAQQQRWTLPTHCAEPVVQGAGYALLQTDRPGHDVDHPSRLAIALHEPVKYAERKDSLAYAAFVTGMGCPISMLTTPAG